MLRRPPSSQRPETILPSSPLFGSGLYGTGLPLSGRAGTILVVATAEPTSLTDAYAFIKVTLSNEPAADIRAVINSADTKGDGQRTYETLRKACANFLKAVPPLAGIIRRDRKIFEELRPQNPTMVRHPGADAALARPTVRRLGTGCVTTRRYRGTTYQKNKKQ